MTHHKEDLELLGYQPGRVVCTQSCCYIANQRVNSKLTFLRQLAVPEDMTAIGSVPVHTVDLTGGKNFHQRGPAFGWHVFWHLASCARQRHAASGSKAQQATKLPIFVQSPLSVLRPALWITAAADEQSQCQERCRFHQLPLGLFTKCVKCC